MSNNNGGPAFPNSGYNGWGEPEYGMTLRDYFASDALKGMLANPSRDQTRGKPGVHLLVAYAYEYADAMLAERSKSNG